MEGLNGWRRLAGVAAVLVVAALAVGAVFLFVDDSSSESGSVPLEPVDDARLGLHLNADAGRVDDLDPSIPLANPTEHPVRIIAVEMVADPQSPGQVTVEKFRLAGPDRTTRSISGGLLTERDFGAPLIPAEDAVVPAGAATGDYILVVRVAGDRDAGWSSSTGMRLTYEWDGETYETTWNRAVTYCSRAEMGEAFCSELGT